MNSATTTPSFVFDARWSSVVNVAVNWVENYVGSEAYFFGNVMVRRMDALIQMVNELRHLANSEGVSAKLSGRIKSFESTRRKMVNRQIAYCDVFDLVGVRVVVESIEHCYRLLDCVHRQYTQVTGHERDYIANPKTNGYQSLHTTVRDPNGVSIEVQLRTSSMQERSEVGPASHETYKSILAAQHAS